MKVNQRTVATKLFLRFSSLSAFSQRRGLEKVIVTMLSLS